MKTELDEILTPSKPVFRQVVSPRKIRSLQLLAAHTQRLFDTFGIRISPKGQSKMVERIMKTGRNRVYRRRPQLVDPVSGFREPYGDRRKRLIIESQRQGVEVAAAHRADQLNRRGQRAILSSLPTLQPCE